MYIVSSLKLEKPQTKPSIDEKRTIVSWFSTYCKHEFGISIWNNFMENERFNELYEKLLPIYGIAVFKEIADIVSELQNIPIVNLLKDFSNFMNKYY